MSIYNEHIQSQLRNASVECKFEKATSINYVRKWLLLREETLTNHYAIVTVKCGLTYSYRFKCNEAQLHTGSHHSISKQQRDSEWRRVYIRTVAPIIEDIENEIREHMSEVSGSGSLSR